MGQSQANEPIITPTHDEIVELTKHHIAAMEATNDDSVWMVQNMRHILVTLVGRKTGITRKTPLPYWLDENGHRIVVASFAGSENHPAWFHNLADTEANPTVAIREREREFRCDAEILDGDDYEHTWARLTADRPFYVGYQEKTQRRIPLIRLIERAG